MDSHREILDKKEMLTLDRFADPKQALASWIEWFLNVILSRGQHPYLGRMIVRNASRTYQLRNSS